MKNENTFHLPTVQKCTIVAMLFESEYITNSAPTQHFC